MSRTRVLSGLVGLGLAVGFAGGQAPPGTPPKPAETKPKADAPAKGTLEEAIASALKNNPDVRVAEAEAQVAQAKLAQAKLAVAQKVAAAHAAVERAKAEATTAEAEFNRVNQLQAKGFVPPSVTDTARQKLESAKAAVAKAEADYNAVLGVMPGKPVAMTFIAETVALSDAATSLVLIGDLRTNRVTLADAAATALATKPVTGSVADKVREALEKPVKLTMHTTIGLNQFVGELKQGAGLDVTFRFALSKPRADRDETPKVAVEPATNTLGGWLQLAEDENPGLRFALREYGILVTDAATLPAGAVAVQEFWKQVRAEKAAKEKAEKEKAEKK